MLSNGIEIVCFLIVSKSQICTVENIDSKPQITGFLKKSTKTQISFIPEAAPILNK